MPWPGKGSEEGVGSEGSGKGKRPPMITVYMLSLLMAYIAKYTSGQRARSHVSVSFIPLAKDERYV